MDIIFLTNLNYRVIWNYENLFLLKDKVRALEKLHEN